MTTRTALPGTSTNGTVWTEADINMLPGGWLGYLETTTPQTGISTEVDVTTLNSLTVTVNTSRRIKITGAATFTHSAAQGYIKGTIRDGTTQIGVWVNTHVEASERLFSQGSVIVTPTAGSHTYKLTILTDLGTVDISSASGQPAYLLVEDIGPA